jgi:hypothetical protein
MPEGVCSFRMARGGTVSTFDVVLVFEVGVLAFCAVVALIRGH